MLYENWYHPYYIHIAISDDASLIITEKFILLLIKNVNYEDNRIIREKLDTLVEETISSDFEDSDWRKKSRILRILFTYFNAEDESKFTGFFAYRLIIR